MLISALIICNIHGNILLSRFFDEDFRSIDSATYELKLLEHFRIYFNTMESGIKRCITLGDIQFVMDFTGELYFIIGGRDFCDEIVLSYVSDSIKVVVTEQLEGKTSESAFLDSDNYGKVCVALDELVCQGIVENLDTSLVEKLAKLKNFP